MARWQEAHDALLDFYTFMNSQLGQDYAAGYAKSVGHGDRPLPGDIVDRLAERLSVTAFNADPVYVDPDMMTLWEAAIPGFQPEPLHPQDLITPNGFIWLPRPLEWLDIHGKKASFRAIMWASTEVTITAKDIPAHRPMPGLMLTLLHLAGDPDGSGSPPDSPFGHDRRLRGKLMIAHTMPWIFGADYGGRVVRVALRDGDDPTTLVRNEAGEAEFGFPQTEDSAAGLSVLKPAQCLLRLIQQTIAVRDDRNVGGQFRGRAQRANFPEKQVVVVTLRRPRAPDTDHEERDVAWTHRWLVSGHWRNQWYATIGMHRQIWISPFVKGPEDMPLEVRKVRAFQWTR